MANRVAANFITGLVSGGIKSYSVGRQIQQDQAIDAALKAKPEQMQGYTAEDGRKLEALANAKDVLGNPLYQIGTDAQGNYTATPTAENPGQGQGVMPSQVISRHTVTDFMGERTAGALTAGQVGAMRARKLIEAGALTDPMRAASASLALDKSEREDADRRELQQALRGAPEMTAPGAGAVGGIEQATASANGQIAKRVANDSALDYYLKTSTPKVIDVLLRQGKVDQAQAYQKFLDTQEGRDYARGWTDGVRKFSIGDTRGALQSFENLYNRQLYRDGNTVKLQPGREPNTMTVTQFGADGQELGAVTQPTDDLLSQAAIFLAPHEAVKFYANQGAKRTAESAQLQRQQVLEAQRQVGRDAMEDRRDARTAQQIEAADRRAQRGIDAADQRLTRQLDARGNPVDRPLTSAQQRSNAEIDAAREAINGLSLEEIRRRTSKATNTGRENPNYDPGLARQAALANRRKIGEDDTFDTAPRGPALRQQQDAATRARQDLAKRFSSDASMNKYKLGQSTDRGVEVLDSRGKLIGYYR
ncbi:hypothetical protein [Ottowia sp.]|mgnify:CR=1 FL=1|uniref:hypothetical protein n=1 Tax=Ottowia sp. TaxID=1898956 RepID=UPI002BE4828F|nr:hypothetical protein [Ottowia sp.]HOB65834.1 hypothetical protein [Ottowia sp.]HPZ57143.1 hypothetical protein [Ottowia sp.]HQD46802.1 hypothetical protein [Ottowia sp.]